MLKSLFSKKEEIALPPTVEEMIKAFEDRSEVPAAKTYFQNVLRMEMQDDSASVLIPGGLASVKREFENTSCGRFAYFQYHVETREHVYRWRVIDRACCTVNDDRFDLKVRYVQHG